MITTRSNCDVALYNPLPDKSEAYFTAEQINLLDKTKLPSHIAIIPDGNRRWAKLNTFNVSRGHRVGADNLMTIVKAAKALGIKSITFFLFSTENWMRGKAEVNALLWLMESFLIEQRQPMIDHGIHFHTIGDLTKFSNRIQNVIQESKLATADCKDVNMVAALNYGGRDEITRAVKNLVDDFEKKKFPKESINETLISKYLDTMTWSDPELLIRTSGEKRISNFLLWQISYSEIYVSDVLWPEFTPAHFFNALLYYQTRERRLGG
jgi:undecaprenyl diphosphate synthase